MLTRTLSQPCGGRLDPHVFYAAEPTRGANPPVEGDSPTEGTVPGPLAPQPRPGDVERETDAEDRGHDEGRRRPDDGVEDLKRMEQNAEDGRD